MGFLFSLRVARTNSPSGKRALVKVTNTATEGEALIWSMYINYFDGTVCIGESVLHFEKASKFHGYNFQIENSTDVVLPGWILLSINEHGCTLIIPQN